jgi:aminoglycoside phosphotransferase (APT) family kinase protein
MLEDRPDVDGPALRGILDGELGVDVASLDVLADGLNLLVSVETAADGDGEEYVLRAPRKLRDASYMNDLQTEYAVMETFADTPLPTPDPVLYCADESALDAPFVAMTRVDGDVVPLGSELPQRWQNPNARERFATVLVDALAQVHALEPPSLPEGLAVVTPSEQVVRSKERLEAATAATDLDVPALDRVGDWLDSNAPSVDDGDLALVHGDFRPGNVCFAGGADPAVSGVLDWETAFVGDPRTELGYLLLRWRDDGDPTPALDDVAARYPDHEDEIDHLRRVNERGFAPYSSEPGSPTRSELVERYETGTGRRFDHPQFHVALAAFNLATVWADLHRQAVDAGEPSDHPPHVEHVARVAELVVDGALVV